ncbi:MAG: DNA modification methylase, partial [Candidatus Hydrogenedentes bacterium]|nr:DNA modification methylase [Candidatus Hydrogenedentota bacterium]
NLTDVQKRALALADNKIAENAAWNEELLAQELQYLTEVEIDFDVNVTGFSTAEIDFSIESLAPENDDPEADELPDVLPDEDTIVRPGDLWRMGPHRLLCGDATNGDDFASLLGRKRAQMVFTDSPFNVRIDGHVCGKGRIRHREFAMASGEMSEAQFTNFLKAAFCNMAAYSIDGAIHYIFMDWRHIGEIVTAGREAYTELKNLCVWNKTNSGMGTFYRSKHELVFVFKKGSAPHINNFELGQHGRHRTNVWDYPGVNSFRNGRLEELKMHPTVKPVALVADAIKDCSRRGGIVLDPFAGSGTILIAAQKTGRRAYAMELDPRYVETAIRRWQDYTGEEAVHAETGRTFDQMRKTLVSNHEAHATEEQRNLQEGS